jgi:hypothetical protein
MYRYSAYQAGESGGLSGGRTVPTSHCPRSALARQPRSSGDPVSSGRYARRSSRDFRRRRTHWRREGDSSDPHEEYYHHETAPFDRYGIPFGNKGPMRTREGPTVRIRLPPPKSRRTFSPLQLNDPGRGAHRGIGLTIQGHDRHCYVPPADADAQWSRL